jgi:DNA-binding transcriptional ArsR family regulator
MMWALAHPIRFRIWELLREGPATASQLGRRLDESRGLLSYHLRVLARASAIVEDEDRGTRRERWWRRQDVPAVVPIPSDPEGRAIDRRLLATLFARQEDVRARFVTSAVSDEWQENAFVGNWYVDLTPEEAYELGRRLFLIVDQLRGRKAASPGAAQTLVSVSVLPVLERD